MPQTKHAVTYRDYLALPDERRFELIEGELCLVPSPGFFHQTIVLNVGALLRSHVKSHNLGVILVAPFDVVLSEHEVVQPDVFFVSQARRAIITEACVRGAPDLVIEIVSATHRERDVLIKKALYARHRVGEYWIVDAETGTVERLVHEGTTFRSCGLFSSEETLDSPLLPGLKAPIGQIFESP